MRNMGKWRKREKRRANISKILVLFKDGQLVVRKASASVNYFVSQGYEYITSINIPSSDDNIKKVQHYYEQHPEKIAHYFLK